MDFEHHVTRALLFSVYLRPAEFWETPKSPQGPPSLEDEPLQEAPPRRRGLRQLEPAAMGFLTEYGPFLKRIRSLGP